MSLCQTTLSESKLEPGLTSASQMSRHRVTGPGLLHLALPGDTEAGATSLVTRDLESEWISEFQWRLFDEGYS